MVQSLIVAPDGFLNVIDGINPYPLPLSSIVIVSTLPVSSFTVKDTFAGVPLGSVGVATTGIGGLKELYPCPPSIKLIFLIPPIKDLTVAPFPLSEVMITLGLKSKRYLLPPVLGIILETCPAALTATTALAPLPKTGAIYSTDLILISSAAPIGLLKTTVVSKTV